VLSSAPEHRSACSYKNAPMPDELVTGTFTKLSLLLRKKEISPVELTEQTLARIERLDPQLNSYITVMADTAREEARCAEQEIFAGNYRGPLHGIPVSVKDMFATRGRSFNCAIMDGQ